MPTLCLISQPTSFLYSKHSNKTHTYCNSNRTVIRVVWITDTSLYVYVQWLQCYYYYYQFYQLGTGRFHKKAKPIPKGKAYTQSQREPIGIKQGRTLLNFKSKKKNPLQGETEPAGHPDFRPGATLSGPTRRGQLYCSLITLQSCIIHISLTKIISFLNPKFI